MNRFPNTIWSALSIPRCKKQLKGYPPHTRPAAALASTRKWWSGFDILSLISRLGQACSTLLGCHVIGGCLRLRKGGNVQYENKPSCNRGHCTVTFPKYATLCQSIPTSRVLHPCRAGHRGNCLSILHHTGQCGFEKALGPVRVSLATGANLCTRT